MNSLVNSLWHEARGSFERLPVWLPGTPMSLGDVGVFDESGWTKQTTLAELGVRFSADPAGEPVDYDYSSHDGAQVSTRLAAAGAPALGVVGAAGAPALGAVGNGNLEMHVRFSRQGAFVLKAGAVTVRRIADQAGVDEQILERYGQGRWRREWVLVSEVARGGPSITIVSGSDDGEAVIDLGAAGPTGSPLLAAGFGVRSRKGLAAAFVTATEAALLWRGRRVYDPWWSSEPKLVDRGGVPRGGETPGDPDGGGPDHGGRRAGHLAEVEYPEDLP
ncbi:hypothetical protein [Planosporangium mesophilum]|uniref:Uncharacterized protein n=1 Tax=Planosporangium mesophilum TaxID=689768 RepID=A0A8J3TE67_9ACTN|nr:hypothetical protein [Planosporangium mesophilum]NJC84543.1 hypothetical protein [Planosporangium mesophilum]GII23851.1 hypothetical protein Pme01_34480 [Planosporangium mesophilum]